MNSLKPEILAVNEVERSLVVTDLLAPYISKRDKEPLYDGYVYIYNNKNKSNNSFVGRVAVQVKGKYIKKWGKEVVYPIERIALEKYLEEGVLYFVGLINQYNKVTLFHICLTPVLIRDILSKMGNQKSKSLTLYKFPDDLNGKLNKLLNFREDIRKQISFVKDHLLTMEDLENPDLVTEVTFSFTGYGYEDTDAITAILDNPVYLYAKIKGCNVPLPVSGGPVKLTTIETVYASIRVGERVFYNSYTKQITAGEVMCQFGQSMSLTLTKHSVLYESKIIETEIKGKVLIRFSEMLKQCVIDIDFILTFLKEGILYINDQPIALNISIRDLKQFNVEVEKQRLKKYKCVCELLEILHVKQDVNITKLTKKDKNGFDVLIQSILYGEMVSGLPNELKGVQTVEIAGLKLLLVFEKTNDNPVKYKIYNYFESKIALRCEYNKKKIRSSLYTILQKDGYLHIANIDYTQIVPSYKELAVETSEIYSIANNDMLMMLLAYDEGRSTNKELLTASEEMAKWLIENDNTLPLSLKTINLLQIIRRRRELNENEKKQLYLIVEDAETDEGCKTAAYLLLDQLIPAKLHFNKQKEEEQRLFMQYPISKFWGEDNKNKLMING